MANTTYTLSHTWGSSARYTASGSTDVNLSNPNDNKAIHWVITTSDTTPTDDPATVNKLLPGVDKSMTLSDGDRLWIAADGGYASVEV